MNNNKRIAIIGINTEVGKTVVSAILTEALDAYYWKPVQCGTPRDRDWVNSMLSKKNKCFEDSFSLVTPCSPHLAAKKEGLWISPKDLIPPNCVGSLVIEGTGGVLCPLNENETWADAAHQFEANFILVHHHYLGSLNHFYLTVELMRQRKLPLLGVIFNGEGDLETEEMLLKNANAKCLGRLTWNKNLTPALIQKTAMKWRAIIQQELLQNEI